ncbi:hypothetical protein Moror_16901 [Moniliophthora roreri MCA 2997]|uniref:Uncharacterized protein n=1 Tax=Moniliophthora roreri (strain MCA 2997) TaxID=1381753 RepID=V2YDC6_MONRO|nr:hypothetical protein Moror_16901 [Moniliophthora roreri MCA 2997]KAI3596394.1 hypothetical protein WG66_003112 [Moniliophthora roreri]
MLARQLWHIDEVEPDASTPTRLEMAYMVSDYEPSSQAPIDFVPLVIFKDLYTVEIALRMVKRPHERRLYCWNSTSLDISQNPCRFILFAH